MKTLKLNTPPNQIATQDDYQKLINLLGDNTTEISSQLLWALSQAPYVEPPQLTMSLLTKKKEILKYDKAVQLTLQLGWIEHTSDWDPYYVIQLKDGTTIETASGYSSIDLEKSTDTELAFDSQNVYMEEIQIMVPIASINILTIER